MMQDEHVRLNRKSRLGMQRLLAMLGEVLGRSFFPFMALAIILGTPWWGGWVTLILALVCWGAVMRFV